MRLRAGVRVLQGVLLAAVGSAPIVACGGSEMGDADGPSGGAGGAGSGGVLVTGGASPTGGSGGVPSDQFECRNSQPLYPSPAPQSVGLELCEGGVVHRVPGQTCLSSLDPSRGPFGSTPPPQDAATPAPPNVACRTNGDCTEHPHGFCEALTNGGFGPPNGGSQCRYGCLTDADCDEYSACVCGFQIGECVAAGCRSDDDCEGGEPCAYVTSGGPCEGASSFKCGVDCRVNDDCPTGYKCERGGCKTTAACGRPFLVEGSARVAPPAIRRDWVQDGAPLLDGIGADVRAALAAHWTELGLMEHASVAAFARFVLQLLSLGAPASLVASATAALGDETEHARLCFGIASAYAGRSIGPGALPMSSALDGGGFVEIVRTAFLEACVGETCAALEAAECAEHATDPFIAGSLRRIAADETRHAELGWKFVTWALESTDAATRRDLLRAFGALVTASDAAPSSASGDDAALLAHAVPSPALRFATRCAAVGDVVRPCLAALAARFGESAADAIAAAA